MKRAAAKVAPETPQEAAEREFWQAIEALRNAKDGRGLLIMICPSGPMGIAPSAIDFRAKISEFLRFMHGSQFAAPAFEYAFARNLGLLTVAWAAAIKREMARKAPPPL